MLARELASCQLRVAGSQLSLPSRQFLVHILRSFVRRIGTDKPGTLGIENRKLSSDNCELTTGQ